MQKRKKDVWFFLSWTLFGLFLLFLVYPLLNIFRQAVTTADGRFTFREFQEILNNRSYIGTIWNSFKVSTASTAVALLLGIPFAYFYTFIRIRGSKALFIVSILSCMSAPFVGAYAWILLLGRAGIITVFLRSIGIDIGSIYGFSGIILVQSTKLFPLVFLYMIGAFRNIDNTLMEASQNLGCKGVKRFFSLVLMLTMPTILASALVVFMRAFADFGTPLIIGRNYQTFPVEIYNNYIGEMGTNKPFASALSIVAIGITGLVFLVQKVATSRFQFTMNAMHPIEKKSVRGLAVFPIYLFLYGIVFISIMPNIYLLITSFRNIRGTVFREGYSLQNYIDVFRQTSFVRSISNTLMIGFIALFLIVLISVIMSYLVVRRKSVINNTIDTFSIIPFVMPGAVLGIALITGFNAGILNSGFLVLSGTYTIMIIAVLIRRMPYTIRSTTATLMQISESVEEASISLGASKMKTFFQITVPMMKNGIVSGAILSFVAIVGELSTGILLYTHKTITLSVSTYLSVLRGNYGGASVLSTILLAITTVALFIYMKVTKMEDVKL